MKYGEVIEFLLYLTITCSLIVRDPLDRIFQLPRARANQ